MAYPRSKTRMLAIGAVALAAATPALALAADAPAGNPADSLSLAAPGSPTALAIRKANLAREHQERVAARRERRNAGPFVPVAGKVDYGTSANAFGAARSGHVHSGHDMFAPSGTPLVAVTDGVIVDVGTDGGQGNYAHLYDPAEDRTFIYMHMVAPAKHQTGDQVDAGDLLGGVGCTGSCSGEHLHFEIRDGKGMAGEAHDPLPELKKWESIPKPL
jgi:murein DD-endopeptidase MepM/ murein hydrolase activator NlpD